MTNFPVTLNLTIYGMVVAVLAGIPLGIISALRRDTWVDYIARIFSIIGLSVPVFWLGVMILLLFAFTWGWQPSIQYINPFDDFWGNFQQMIWPAVTLGYFQAAFIARMTRSSLLEVLFEGLYKNSPGQGIAGKSRDCQAWYAKRYNTGPHHSGPFRCRIAERVGSDREECSTCRAGVPSCMRECPSATFP